MLSPLMKHLPQGVAVPKRFIGLTAYRCGDMLKPKAVVDPEIIKAKWDRKKNKLLREIKAIQQQGRKYKPVDELRLAPNVRKEMNGRIRKNPELTEEELDRRYLVKRNYARYLAQMKNKQTWKILKMVQCQREALDELKAESEFLFQAAVAPVTVLDVGGKGPTETPPLRDYQALEGAYTDVSKNWDKGSTAADFIVEKKKKAGMKKLSASEKAEKDQARLLKEAKALNDPKLLKMLESTPKRK